MTDTEMTDTDTMRDPVCGMSVTPMTATTSTVFGGQTYYFCSDDCYHTFMADPNSFTSS